MGTLKKVLKIVGFSLLGLVTFVGVYLLTEFVLSRIAVAAEQGTPSEITIYILTNGVHTDLVMPVKTEEMDWSRDVRFENTIAQDTTARFIAFGWGDKGFYLETPTWADLKFSTAFKATFSLSTAAIHATFYKQLREGEDCKKINISREQYVRLVKYISGTFITGPDGRPVHIVTDANYDDYDAFYEAKGSYNLFHTCNTWANNGLKSCGQKASLWTAFDTGIFYHYKD